VFNDFPSKQTFDVFGRPGHRNLDLSSGFEFIAVELAGKNVQHGFRFIKPPLTGLFVLFGFGRA
jgi:hypothetical protein